MYCSFCHELKSENEMIKDKRNKNGLGNWCRSCKSIYDKKWKNNNKEKQNEYVRKYRAKHRNTLKKRNKIPYEIRKKEKNKEWQSMNQHKRKAHWIVESNIKSGKLIKPKSCSICGECKKLFAHHDDYSQPLEVKWVCARCHLEIHGLLKHKKSKA